MTVAERLVSVREANGYTRKQLAEELGKPYATITKYENGQREPGHAYLVLIAQKFGVSVDYLLGIENEEAPGTEAEGITDEQLKFALFGDAAPEISDAQLNDVKRYAKFIMDRE